MICSDDSRDWSIYVLQGMMEYTTVNVAVRTPSDNKLDHQSNPEFAVSQLKYGIFSFVYEHCLCVVHPVCSFVLSCGQSSMLQRMAAVNFFFSVPNIYCNLLLNLEIFFCLSTAQHCRHGICVSREMETRPVDGEWGPWGPYSSCSRTCGGGIKSTTRLCNRPEYVFFFIRAE